MIKKIFSLYEDISRLLSCLLIIGVFAAPRLAFAQPPDPFVAIHVSELTQALETTPATSPTPTGSGTTGFQWWYTSWHYFVANESLQEALRSDGTPFVVVSDSDIAAGKLLYADGSPHYPILISLASEAIADNEISPLRNYVNAGGFLLAGSSSFTRNPNGTTRGDFALANEMGVHMAGSNLLNWQLNAHFTKNADNRLTSHIPNGTLNWYGPVTADEIPWGVSPSHTLNTTHYAWKVVASGATDIADGDAGPLLAVKNYGGGEFIYHGEFQPLIGHDGYDPGMNNYLIYRRAIEWAFETFTLPIVKVSPWPYQYDAAFINRHDFENTQTSIRAIESSAQFDHSLGVKGDYYFCTGALRADMGGNAAVIAGLRNAVSNYGATIGSHNGGLKNPVNTSLLQTDYHYWHWGPDEALDTAPQGYANGKAYASASILASFHDIEGWLSGLDNGRAGCSALGNCPRTWVSPYFNSTRDDSYDILDQLGTVTMGEQKISPFPHRTLSYKTIGKFFSPISIPVSDWYVGTDIAQSIVDPSGGYNHTTASIDAAVDFYYSNGLLINFYTHSPSNDGSVGQEYVTHSMSKPRLWSTNSVGINDWWRARSNVLVTPTVSTAGNTYTVAATISGATDSATAIEISLPQIQGQSVADMSVFFNGTLANPSDYRTTNYGVKARVGSTVSSVQVQYTLLLPPVAVNDTYSTTANTVLNQAAPGVLANDTDPEGASLTAQLVSGPSHGTLTLNGDGSFAYSPITNYVGSDSFTYKANDGTSNSNIATVTIKVLPSLVSVSLSPTSVMGGATSQGTVTLNLPAPSGGTVVLLSDDSSAASEPSSVTVPAGSTSATFTITTSTVTSTTPVTISALYGRVTQSATLILTISASGLAIDATTSADSGGVLAGSTISVPAFSTNAGNELLLAFISASYSSAAPNIITGVSGGGLTWTLVRRTNTQQGASEIWRAFATAPLTNATVTASMSKSGAAASITVVAFAGVNVTTPLGAVGGGSAATGAPTASLTTQGANSWVFGVGNDWDGAVSRTVGAGQTIVHQYLSPTYDTFWVQRQNATVQPAGTVVTINDTAPSDHQWNLSIVEIRPATSTGNNVSITNWKGNKSGAVSLTFDDGSYSQFTVGVPALNARGLKGTFFIITDYIDWDAWETAAGMGHMIESHTMTHPYLTTLSLSQVQTELSGSKAAIDAQIPTQKCETLAYPYGDFNSSVESVAQSFYIAARGITCGLNTEPFDFYNIQACSPDLGDDIYAQTDAAEAQGSWLVFYVHTLNGGADGGGGTWQIDNFTAYLDYLKAKNLWVSTFSDVAKYIRERDSATLSVVSTSSNQIVLNLTDTLDDSTYDEPLTIRSEVPSFCTSALAVQGNKVTTLNSTLEGATKAIYFDAIPDRGEITITLNPANLPPIAMNDTYSTNSNMALNQVAPGLLANDTDPEGATLSASQVSAPSHGTLIINADGFFVYTPATNYAGSDSFTYVANDGIISSNVATVTITINYPVPTTTSISPTAANAGGPAFTLTVNGSNFVSGSVVRWNGANRTTTYVSSTQLTAAITAADIATAGTASVTVFNPAPGGGTSSAQTFTINAITNPVPATTSLSPTSQTAGGAAFTLAVNGSGFINGSVVRWNGANRTTTFVSSTQLTASITAADIATAGTASVTVFNSTPGGGTSNTQSFTIDVSTNPAPTTTSLSPASATAGGAAFTLTINGSNFVSGSVVRWNGANRTTTYVSSTQLTAAITAADIATAGTASVTVFNPTPGGGTSIAQTFTINAITNPVPTTTSLSPTSRTVGGAAFTLTVNGTGFVSGSVVRWNGSNRSTTYVSATRLTAAITAADIATAGTAQVTVFNPTPGGGTSSARAITINNPVPTTTSLSPTSRTAGGAAFTLTVNGTGFVSGSVVRWNGSNRSTTYVSATRLRAAITAADIATRGTAQVTVFNPTPGGGTSSARSFRIN